MLSYILILSLAVGGLASETPTLDLSTPEKWEPALDELFVQVDTDENGILSLVELDITMDRLGITPEIIYDVCACTTPELIAEYDANDDGGLEKDEVIELVKNKMDLQQTIIDALTRAPDPNVDLSVPAVVTDAKVKIVSTFEIDGTATLYAGDRSSILAYFATLWGVSETTIWMTFLESKAAAEPASESRRLKIGDIVVTATGFMADQASADAASAATDAALSDPAAATIAIGFTVTVGATTASSDLLGSKEMSMPPLIIAGILFLLLCVFTCVAACVMSKKANSAGVAGGCCEAGCCSYFALPTWAKTNMFAALLVMLSTVFLYLAVDKVAAELTCLLDGIKDLSLLEGEASDAVAELPMDIIDLVKEYVQFLSLVVLAPGLAAGFMLITNGACFHKKQKGCYCGPKCLVALGHLLLVGTLVVSIIMTALGAVMYQSFVTDMLRTITDVCDTVVPLLDQIIADATTLLASTADLGIDPVELASIQYDVDNAVAGTVVFKVVCKCMNALFNQFSNLLVPGVFTVVSLFYALYTNQATCCAASCCGNPNKTSKVAPTTSTEMSNLS